MRRSRLAALAALIAGLSLIPAFAQGDDRPQPGDPPRLNAITISEADEDGIVTITGGANAVFPTAQLAVRNLYTGETLYTQASITGGFTAKLYGPGTTPFLISPAPNIPQPLQDRPGSLPGGPATIVYGDSAQAERSAYTFTISGALAEGDSRWSAQGTINQVTFATEDPTALSLSLQVVVPLPDGNVPLNALRFIGLLELQPVAIRQNGAAQATAAYMTNNGWSSTLTPGGLPIDDVGEPIVLAETAIGADVFSQVVDGLAFNLDFERRLPADLRPGLYVPVLRGLVRVSDGAPESWAASSAFDGSADTSTPERTRLPLVINVGGVESVHLPWALFMNTPSDGSRGLLPEDDQAQFGLSNRVRFNAPIYTLPLNAGDAPAVYSLEPHLLMQLPNRYDRSAPPLIPFAFPGGHLDVRIEAPDGTVTNFGRLPVLQSQLSTDSLDERVRFGAQSPLDTYQLTTLDPALTRFSFAQYGEHIIELSGEVQDGFGNRYTGGGRYHVWIAEPLDLTPSVLPGTPFNLGDVFHAGLHIIPGIPADVRIHMRVFPFDGGEAQAWVIEGTANADGHFLAADELPIRFETPGEYIIDYEARYTDSEGRLWAGALRSAGLIDSGSDDIIARGRRGLAETAAAQRLARYTVETLLEAADITPEIVVMQPPYHSGDQVWIADGAASALMPSIRLQDRLNVYEPWLLGALSTDISPAARAVREGAALDELPAALLDANGHPYNPASGAAPADLSYSYANVVHPGFSVRQFILGGVMPTLPLWFDLDDPLNEQIGAGVGGLRPGDYLFIFGGVRLDNAETDTRSIAIYGAAASVIAPNDGRGARISSPGRGADGGADAGPLLVLGEDSYDAFFVPTGLPAGSVMTLGDTFAFSGQLAPTLPGLVEVQVTAPSGAVRSFSGRANSIGYYYDPAHDFALNETGVWTVGVRVTIDGHTSVGAMGSPLITGGIPGAPDGVYQFYVRGRDDALLERPVRPDLAIPSALPYNLSLVVPSGWQDVRVHVTVSTAGYVIDQRTLPLSGRSISYQRNLTDINRAFPNIEVEGRADGAAASDAHRVIFFVEGRDENGRPRTLYRAFTFFHDRLISLG